MLCWLWALLLWRQVIPSTIPAREAERGPIFSPDLPWEMLVFSWGQWCVTAQILFNLFKQNSKGTESYGESLRRSLAGEGWWWGNLCTILRRWWGRIPGAQHPLELHTLAHKVCKVAETGQSGTRRWGELLPEPGSMLGGKPRCGTCPPSAHPSGVLWKSSDASTISISSNPSQLPDIISFFSIYKQICRGGSAVVPPLVVLVPPPHDEGCLVRNTLWLHWHCSHRGWVMKKLLHVPSCQE